MIVAKKDDESNQEQQNKKLRQMGIFMTIPFVLAVPPLIGWLTGSWLDDWLHTKPYLMFVMIILGFAAGVREFYRIIKTYGSEP
jgi:ATP synthase protein I